MRDGYACVMGSPKTETQGSGEAHMSEADLQRQIQMAVSKTRARLFRNQVGQGWYGDWDWAPGSRTDIIIRHARPLKAGLCPGSSDLIGWTRTGQFVGCEVKSARGKLTEDQRNFLDAVRRAGGIGIEARSVEDVLKWL